MVTHGLTNDQYISQTEGDTRTNERAARGSE
jgi:hypothetical protein